MFKVQVDVRGVLLLFVCRCLRERTSGCRFDIEMLMESQSSSSRVKNSRFYDAELFYFYMSTNEKIKVKIENANIYLLFCMN